MKRKRITGIYRITSPSGRIYIGQSVDIYSRGLSHSYEIKRRNSPLYSSIKKYGWSNHKMEVIHELPYDISQGILNEYEIFYIQQYRECGIKVMNLESGGNKGKIGAPKSEETRRKLSLALKGKPMSQEHKEKISKALMGKKNAQGSIRSEEYRRNLSASLKGIHKGRIPWNKGLKDE